MHFKYVWHDTLPGWAITHHEASFYSSQYMPTKNYVLDGWAGIWAWHSMPITRIDWRAVAGGLTGSPIDYAHLMPSRILEIDWRSNTKI